MLCDLCSAIAYWWRSPLSLLIFLFSAPFSGASSGFPVAAYFGACCEPALFFSFRGADTSIHLVYRPLRRPDLCFVASARVLLAGSSLPRRLTSDHPLVPVSRFCSPVLASHCCGWSAASRRHFPSRGARLLRCAQFCAGCFELCLAFIRWLESPLRLDVFQGKQTGVLTVDKRLSPTLPLTR